MEREEIKKYADNIMVIKPFDDLVAGEKRWAVVQDADPFTESCTWKDTVQDKEVVVEKDSILGMFHATHTFGHPSLFKPSLAEVIEAMPKEFLQKCNAVHVQYDGFNEDNSKHVSNVTAFNVNIKESYKK